MAEVAPSSTFYQKSPLETLVRQSSRRAQNSPRLLTVGTAHSNGHPHGAPASPLLHTRFRTSTSTSTAGEDDTTSTFAQHQQWASEDSESNYSSGPESPYAETGFQHVIDPSHSPSMPTSNTTANAEADRQSWASDGSQSTVQLNHYVPHSRDTWRSSTNSVDPFAFRQFESPTKGVPQLIVTSPTRSLPRNSVIEVEAITQGNPIVTRTAPSMTQYNISNFSRPIRSHAASDEKSKWQVLERNRSQKGTNPVQQQMMPSGNQHQNTVDNGRSTSPHSYPQYIDNNAVPSGPSRQPYPPTDYQTKTISPTYNLTPSFGYSQYDSRYSQPNVEYSQSNTGYSHSNTEYFKSTSADHSKPNTIGYSQSYIRQDRSSSPSELSPSNMQNRSASPGLYVTNSGPKQYLASPPPPFPPPSLPGSPSSTENMLPGDASITPGATVRLPGAPPQLRPPSKLSLYSTYSFYQLDDESRTPSPSSPQHFAQSPQFPGPSPQNAGNTLTIDPHNRRSPRASPSPSSSPTPGPSYQQPEPPTTAEDYLLLGIQHHEANRLTESARCFQLSATLKGGCGVGMLMWGLALRHAWGTQKDEKTAFRWLRRAAEAAVGDLEAARAGKEQVAVQAELVLAIYEVGQCFFHGWGVAQDKKMAVSYFQVAARLGDMDAQQELAYCLANGKGCKKNLKEAAKWYRAAAEQGASTVGLAWIYKSKYN